MGLNGVVTFSFLYQQGWYLFSRKYREHFKKILFFVEDSTGFYFGCFLLIHCHKYYVVPYSQLYDPENIDYNLLKFLYLYFTILRLIVWDIEQHHMTTLKIPYVLRHLPFLQSTLTPRGGVNIDFDILEFLHLYFTILRWIDWDIEQHHTTTLKIPYVFCHLPFFTVNFEAQ